MQYTKESVELAIELIFPEIKKSKNSAISFSVRDSLEDMAVKYFIGDENFSKEQLRCFEVGKQAIKDIYTKGYMEFGNKSLSDELAALS